VVGFDSLPVVLRVIECASQSNANSRAERKSQRDVANEDANDGAYACTDRHAKREPIVLSHDLASLTKPDGRNQDTESVHMTFKHRARTATSGVARIP
jgi:hypothetical protein